MYSSQWELRELSERVLRSTSSGSVLKHLQHFIRIRTTSGGIPTGIRRRSAAAASQIARLVLSGRSAPPPAHQIDVGARLEEGIGRGFDAVHAWDRIKDDVLLLAGVVRGDFRQTDFAERALRTFFRPADRGIVDRVAVLGQLHGYPKPDGFPGNALLDLVKEGVWPARGAFGLAEVFVTGDRQHPVAPKAALTIRIGKSEGGDREKRLAGKAGRNGLRDLNKSHRRGMRGKELLDGVRVRPGRVGGNHCIQKLDERLGGAHREVVDRMTDDVGVDMLGKVKANREAARAGTLRIVVGNRRDTGKVREADC